MVHAPKVYSTEAPNCISLSTCAARRDIYARITAAAVRISAFTSAGPGGWAEIVTGCVVDMAE